MTTGKSSNVIGSRYAYPRIAWRRSSGVMRTSMRPSPALARFSPDQNARAGRTLLDREPHRNVKRRGAPPNAGWVEHAVATNPRCVMP